MSKENREKAKKRAGEILNKYILPIPFSVENLAQTLGYEVFPFPPDLIISRAQKDGIAIDDSARKNPSNILGYFSKEKNRIYINKNQSVNRLRFTIAHEIGHALMHPTGNFRIFNVQDFFSTTPEETEANYFAGYLLMPDTEIIKRLPLTKVMPTGTEIINNFSSMFGVSSEAMRIRFKTFKEENPKEWNEYKLQIKLPF